MFSKIPQFGESIGFGKRPAILVIDYILAFTDETHPLGSNLQKQLHATSELLHFSRNIQIPIVFTTVQYEPHLLDGAHFVKKIPALQKLIEGSDDVKLDPLLNRQPSEPIVIKKFASAFFGTSLSSILTSHQIDTLIITGCTTSGCVRATVVDAMQHGYYPIVPIQCVGDRSEAAHIASLHDIELKYGDVMDVEEVKKILSTCQEDNKDVSSSS